MKKKIATILLSSIAAMSILSGCSSDEGANGTATATSRATGIQASELINGTYYIWHKDNTCEPLYFGNATFDEGSIKTYPENDRIMWYKDDYNKIPTLGKGDKLIYYTTDLLGEKFTFERFEDFGYSIGLCGMEATESGRFSISTAVEDRCTYPGGDTDELLKLENKLVILDTLGGNPVRAIEEENGKYSYLSRCGTITGLKQGANYAAEIYEGTIKHEYVFTSDVRMLGSMEVTETVGYEFESETIINILLPEEFNPGYYMVNGAGLFKYLDGYADVSRINFNLANDIKESNDISQSGIVSSSQIKDMTPTQPNLMVENNESFVSTFEVTGAGTLTVNVSFTIDSTNAEYGDGLPDVTAIITAPSGGSLRMKESADGLTLTFNANELGVYTITYYDLDIRIPQVSITAS